MDIKIDLKLGGLGTTITIVLAILKLVGIIDWSWLMVCLPLIIGFGLSILLVLGMLLFTWIMMKK